MSNIILYTKSTCPFCHKAKALLDQKKATYEEIDISGKETLRAEMIEKANGRTTVPQIFIGDIHVGGCDDLFALEKVGDLNSLLSFK